MLFLCCTRQPGINAYKLLGNRDEAAALNSDPTAAFCSSALRPQNLRSAA